MSRTPKVAWDGSREPLPGAEMLVTDAAKEAADRPQFKGGIGQHVYMNGFDIARIESAGFQHPGIAAKLEAHGFFRPSETDYLAWFRRGDTTYRRHSLAEAILAVIDDLEVPATRPQPATEPYVAPPSTTIEIRESPASGGTVRLQPIEEEAR